MDTPEARLNFFDRGISEYGIGNLRAHWQKDASAMLPDVLSILISVNDVARSGTQASPELSLVLLNPSFRVQGVSTMTKRGNNGGG